MFVANSPGNEWLDVLRIALMMKAQSEPNIPANISRYFDELMAQVHCLVRERCELSKSTLPEAIHLTVMLRQKQPLLKLFDGVSSFNSVTPDLASNILTAIDEYAY